MLNIKKRKEVIMEMAILYAVIILGIIREMKR